MSTSCPVCGQGQAVRESWTKEFEHNGATLEAEHTEAYCDSCGTLLQTPQIIRTNVRNKQRSKNAHDGLLLGEEILAFRVTYGLTQKQAAEIFGGGPTAFAKYEADEIAHNVSMDRLLRLCLAEPHNILLVAEQALIALTSDTVDKINSVENQKFSAMIAEAFAEMEASDPPRRKADRSANDNIFELFAGGPAPCPENTASWAIELAVAA